MSKPVTVSDLTFQTKGAAKQFFGAIQNRYADGQRFDAEDLSLIRGLLACHPERKDKTGVGVAWFSVETETVFGRTRHFVVHRTDLSFSDFSFHACIDGGNEKRDRLESLRRAVAPQVVDFRERCFATGAALICPLRGVAINSCGLPCGSSTSARFSVAS